MALWGLGMGLAGSLFLAAIREYFERSALHAGAVAHQLGVSVLGELPALPWKASRR
jgi:capsular polysaccharide biosynthesis protein